MHVIATHHHSLSNALKDLVVEPLVAFQKKRLNELKNKELDYRHSVKQKNLNIQRLEAANCKSGLLGKRNLHTFQNVSDQLMF